MNEQEAIDHLTKLSLKQAFIRGEGVFDSRSITASIVKEISESSETNAITRGFKQVNKITEEALKVVEESLQRFYAMQTDLQDSEDKLTKATKSATSKIKSSVNEVSDSIRKLEGIRGMESLNKYAETLSNVAESLERIAELEKSGKLDKLIKALS